MAFSFRVNAYSTYGTVANEHLTQSTTDADVKVISFVVT